MSANETQIGGDHYKNGGEEHWDRVYRLELDYFQGQITKYVERCWKKNGIQDLRKARHVLDKYIELKEAEAEAEAGAERRKMSREDNNCLSAAREVVLGAQHPHVQSMGAEVKPTGWVGYVFEGADADGFLFTCDNCRGKVRTAPNVNPNTEHRCE